MPSSQPSDAAVRLASSDSGSLPVQPNRRAEQPRVVLSWLEKSAITSAPSDEHADALVELTEGLATALSGEDADPCRHRTIARLVANEKTTLETLRTAFGTLVGAGRYVEAKAVDRMLTEATKRIARLLELHRSELDAGTPKSLVLIQHAEAVRMQPCDGEG